MKFLKLLFPLFLPVYVSAQKPAIAAHRGKACRVPENTLKGIEQILPTGVSYIEIDVRMSKDGQLVVMHDGSLKRTTNNRQEVKNLNWSELQKVKISGWLNIRFQNHRIPSLEEVCEVVSGWNSINKSGSVYLYVDCKEADPQLLLETLRKYNLEKQSVFYGNDRFLAELKAIEPTVRIMPGLKNAGDLMQKIKTLEPYAFDVPYSLLSQHFVSAIHSHGILVFTDLLFLNDRPSAYKKAIRYGVDVIQTDKSRKALKVLSGRK